jgi:plasmid stabilization system protein ParE
VKLVYLADTQPDMRWFRRYYSNAFPDGRANAQKQFLATQRILLENPHIGHPSETFEGAREFDVVRTPFIFVYRLRADRIEVLRVVDSRSDWMKGNA